MHDDQTTTQESHEKWEWDNWPEVEHTTEVRVLEVDKSELSNQLRYVLLLQDKRNMKSNIYPPIVLDVTVTDDGRLVQCLQDDGEDVVEHYKLQDSV